MTNGEVPSSFLLPHSCFVVSSRPLPRAAKREQYGV